MNSLNTPSDNRDDEMGEMQRPSSGRSGTNSSPEHDSDGLTVNESGSSHTENSDEFQAETLHAIHYIPYYPRHSAEVRRRSGLRNHDEGQNPEGGEFDDSDDGEGIIPDTPRHPLRTMAGALPARDDDGTPGPADVDVERGRSTGRRRHSWTDRTSRERDSNDSDCMISRRRRSHSGISEGVIGPMLSNWRQMQMGDSFYDREMPDVMASYFGEPDAGMSTKDYKECIEWLREQVTALQLLALDEADDKTKVYAELDKLGLRREIDQRMAGVDPGDPEYEWLGEARVGPDSAGYSKALMRFDSQSAIIRTEAQSQGNPIWRAWFINRMQTLRTITMESEIAHRRTEAQLAEAQGEIAELQMIALEKADAEREAKEEVKRSNYRLKRYQSLASDTSQPEQGAALLMRFEALEDEIRGVSIEGRIPLFEYRTREIKALIGQVAESGKVARNELRYIREQVKRLKARKGKQEGPGFVFPTLIHEETEVDQQQATSQQGPGPEALAPGVAESRPTAVPNNSEPQSFVVESIDPEVLQALTSDPAWEGVKPEVAKQVKADVQHLQLLVFERAEGERRARVELSVSEKALRDCEEREVSALRSATTRLRENRGAPHEPRVIEDHEEATRREAEIGSFLYANTADQCTEMVVRTKLLRARVAIEHAKWNQAVSLATEAREMAETLDFAPLVAKCYFWKAIAEYYVRDYRAALESITRSVGCRGYYNEGMWFENWNSAISIEVAYLP